MQASIRNIAQRVRQRTEIVQAGRAHCAMNTLTSPLFSGQSQATPNLHGLAQRSAMAFATLDPLRSMFGFSRPKPDELVAHADEETVMHSPCL